MMMQADPELHQSLDAKVLQPLTEGVSPVAPQATDAADLVKELAKFRALYELATAMTVRATFEDNLLLVVEKSRELLKADTSFIALRDDLRGDVFIHTYSGVRTEALKTLRIPFGAGLGGKVATTGQGRIVRNYYEEVEPLLHDVVRTEGLISGVAVPIQLEERNLGVLYVFNRSETLFTQSDLETLSFLGKLAAVEIGRKRTEEELRQARVYLELRVRQRTQELVQINRRLETEIAQRKHIEEELRLSEEKYRLVVENASDAIFVVQEGIIRFVNFRCTELTGYTKQDLMGRPFLTLVHSGDRTRMAQQYRRTITNQSTTIPHTVRLIHKDGESRWCEVFIIGVIWEGKPGNLCFLKDITVRRAMENELSKVEKLESIGILAAGIAHDFNNILTAVLGNISLALACLPPHAPVSNRLLEAEKACVHAQGLTQQLLAFSKGGTPVKRVAMIADIVRDSCMFALRGSNVRCEFFVDEECPPVAVNEAQLTQVMHNLVINAQHAMPEGGTLKVFTHKVFVSPNDGLTLTPGEYVKISVQDHGVGIPEENIPRVFDPYFTTKARGSGLGLATSFAIIKNHGGLITVDSQVGQGSTFHVYIPATSETVESLSTPDQALVRGQGRVLVMDDDDSIRELVSEMLVLLGYEVELAKDGAEAIALYQQALEKGAPFDVVIMDLTVPGGMGGAEAIRILRQQDPGIKAIVSSGYSSDPIMANYQQYGFCAMVSKPYTVNQMSETLAKVLRE